MELAGIQSVVDPILECSICLQVYQDPRLLPCGHTFCLKCLQELVDKRKSDSAQLSCCLCRSPWTVQPDAISSLPKNFIAIEFISSLSSVIQCGETGSDEKHDKVEHFCIDCWEPLCSSCNSFHKKTKATRSHAVKKITDVNRDDISRHKKQMMSKCVSHNEYPIELYCTVCEDIACTKCFMLSHATHSCIDIIEADSKFVEKINSSLYKLKMSSKLYNTELKLVYEQKKKLRKQNEAMENNVKLLLGEFRTNLKIMYDKLIEKINKYEKTVLDTISSKTSAEISELDNKTRILDELLYTVRENISTLENLLTPTSTAIDRINCIKNELPQIPLMVHEKELPKEHIHKFHLGFTLWKSDFIEWSNNSLKSFSSIINSQATSINEDISNNIAVIAGSKQTLDILTSKEWAKFISFHQNKLLLGVRGATELHIYNIDRNCKSSVRIQHAVYEASWTHQGKIFYTTENRIEAYLVSQTGDIIKQHTIQGSMGIRVDKNYLYLITENDFYISADGGFTFQSQNLLFSSSLRRAVRVTTDICDLYWTIEGNRLHFYSADPIENTKQEHKIQSLPTTFHNLKLYACDIAYDGSKYIFLSDYYGYAIHVFSANGHYIGQLLSEKDGIANPCSLAIDQENKRIFVDNYRGNITSFMYT